MAELRIEIVGERIPGAAPVSEHSQFSSVAEASPAIAKIIALPSTDPPAARRKFADFTGDGETLIE